MAFPGCKNTLTLEETKSHQCLKFYIEIHRIYKKKKKTFNQINIIFLRKKCTFTLFFNKKSSNRVNYIAQICTWPLINGNILTMSP